MQQLSLDGEWQLEYVDYGEGVKKGIHRLDYKPQTPLEAWVPGEVHLDLMREGIIEEPLYGRNALEQQWIEDKEFWYRKEFSIPEKFQGKKVELTPSPFPLPCGERIEVRGKRKFLYNELIFWGLDLDSDIYLNGEKIREHHNMHTPCYIDVTDKLKDNNILAVRLDCGIKSRQGKPIQVLPGEKWYKKWYTKVWARKAQFTYGWDWAPRLLNVGIWRGVELISYEKAALRDIFVHARFSSDYKKATLQISGFLENITQKECKVHLEANLKGGEENFSSSFSFTAHPGLNRIDMSLDVPNPRLWWPHPLGEPFMYEFSLKAREGSFLLDEYSTPIGLREVSLLQKPLSEKEGTSFIIQINKVNVFCKGADWVPPDSLIARVDREKYTKLIDMAKEANFNMLRIWGGGIYEDPYFYEQCARNGIMVWQDFMFACAYYPDDPSFLHQVEKEIETVLKKLRNYTSIVLWCGNNEIQWLHKKTSEEQGTDLELIDFPIYHRIIPRLCALLDPSRPYWFSSPYGGEDPCSEYQGNRHAWQVSINARKEENKANYKLYGKDRGKFISEFGILSSIEKKSLQRFLPKDELYLGSPTWRFHNNQFEKGNIARLLKFFYKDPASLSLDEYLLFSMLIQAEALKYALEHWRRRKFNTAGALFWMYSDCWGATGSWTIVDYYLNRKPSFYYVKRSFAPLGISFKEIEGGLAIYEINDTLENFKGHVEWGLSTFEGNPLEKERKTISIPANSSEKIAEIRFPSLAEEDKKEMFYWAELWEKERLIAKDRYFLTNFGKLNLPLAKVKHDIYKLDDRRYKIMLQSEKFAWFIRLNINPSIGDGFKASSKPSKFVSLNINPLIRFSDNYFDLFPGQVKEIIIENATDEEIKRLSVKWNNK